MSVLFHCTYRIYVDTGGLLVGGGMGVGYEGLGEDADVDGERKGREGVISE